MVLTYIIAAILLLLSPYIGKYTLKYVYPDVKTFVHLKKWLLYTIFGLAAYLPAVIIAFSDTFVSIYSPLGSGILESGGNAIFVLGVYGGIMYLNMSIVEYMMVRRKTGMIIGLPKRVISYSIKKQLVKKKRDKRDNEIARITSELEKIVKDEAEVKPLLTKIRLSVAKERAAEAGKLADLMKEDAMAELAATKEEKTKKGFKEEEPKTEEVKEREVKETSKGKVKAPEAITGLLKDENITLPKVKEDTKKVSKKAEVKGGVADMTQHEKGPEEREKLVAELEKKLMRATDDAKKREKTDSLLNDLKERIREDKEASLKEGEYVKSDVEEITNALREMKNSDKVVEEEKPSRKHGKKKDEGISASVVSYEKSYPRKRQDDILKDVVGDVRQQLVEPKSDGEEPSEGGRWYDKKAVEVEEAPSQEMPMPGTGVELFEEDLSFGDGLGGDDLGDFGDLGGDFGDLGDLEDANQNLESGNFDGMFVEMSDASGGCPRCGKKGTSVVYCSNCGKSLCSNCALSVEGSEDFIKYTCPNCKEEFAMKRRMPT